SVLKVNVGPLFVADPFCTKHRRRAIRSSQRVTGKENEAAVFAVIRRWSSTQPGETLTQIALDGRFLTVLHQASPKGDPAS
ncbi:MAG: hypothetical protein R3236_10135, partial [Phycisphaeraceae bacterium]|nr:hypothetical protein [Phycisphaeraceae bacterium]